jgi:hypothetical protein
MRPRITLSTARLHFRSRSNIVDLAQRLGADGVEIDAASWFSRLSGWRSVQFSRSGDEVTAVWVNPADLDAMACGLIDGVDQLSPLSERSEGAQIVVKLPDLMGSANDQATIMKARQALMACAWADGVTIAVPAVAVEGGRAHLTRLRGLRHLVEEWEMHLGLDLSARTDARWEAEAAVQIAGPRLSLVRLRSPLIEGIGRHSDVHVRTLRTCAERGFAGTVSIATSTPFWLGWHRSSVERDFSVNRDAVIRLFTEQRAQHRASNRRTLR